MHFSLTSILAEQKESAKLCSNFLSKSIIQLIIGRILSSNIVPSDDIKEFILKKIKKNNAKVSMDTLPETKIDSLSKRFSMRSQSDVENTWDVGKISSSLIRCLMITLNIFKLKRGLLFKKLHPHDIDNLLMACVAILLALENNPNNIFDSKNGSDIDILDYTGTISSLYAVIKGLMKYSSERVIG